jgi:SAM-dependent methyltransferase
MTQRVNNQIAFWESLFVCPLDQASLELREDNWVCPRCGFRSALAHVASREVPDFRAHDQKRSYAINFELPVTPLDRDHFAASGFRAVQQDFAHYSRSEVRQRFGTKLDKGIQYYCQQLWQQLGAEAVILDLGCGNGGNRRYLESLGFKHVLCVDWSASGADILVDAHSLPLESTSFDLVLSTAVFEHLYNPFIAISEIARVLKPDGYFLGGASFWEAWHGSSYFHLTPDGWNTLFTHAGLEWVDFWTGWGIVPAALTHVLTPGYLRGFGYALQSGIEAVYRIVSGIGGVRRLQLRASGAYMVCAGKKAIPS